MKKLRVGVLFGGRSGEHEVSLLSAASVLNAIDKNKYDVVSIGITKDGHWVTSSHAENLLRGQASPQHLRAGDPQATSAAAVLAHGDSVIVPPVPAAGGGPRSTTGEGGSPLVPFQSRASESLTPALHVDVIFPVLHGTFGEDGTIQGLLELADIAYVGAGVLGSAAGMDKDVMKRLFSAARLPIVRHVIVLRGQWESNPGKVRRLVEKTLRYAVFVKPANLGSSVGISKVHHAGELAAAMDLAASYDRKIVIEQAVGGKNGKARELECSVLGNDGPMASLPGEVVPGKEFYDYAAKYLEEGSQLVIPARLPKSQIARVQQLAIAAFKAVDCSGLARVDFLMDARSKKIYVNEINTMPGFTSISMYPKLWAASGIPYPQLIDRLIALALERHAEKKKNRYTR
jgi:D-alanine-D-alanine ligase